MKRRILKLKIVDKIRTVLARNTDPFLGEVSGVIHVGANSGQERYRYEKNGLRVLWVEPIPEIFEQLKLKTANFPRQQAIQALITDKVDETYDFNVSNLEGRSSSILDFKEHKEIWPHIEFKETLKLQSTTLPQLLLDHELDPTAYDTLIMDTQGSELLVLQGAEGILKHFTYIKTEVADFESYAGCCQLDDLTEYLKQHHFEEHAREAFKHHQDKGTYYDVTYKRTH
ncbi:MAG: FkbM family methyltransferase [Verrucomicrobiota bacterium]